MLKIKNKKYFTFCAFFLNALFFVLFLVLFPKVSGAEDVTIADVSDPRPRVYSRGYEALTTDLNQVTSLLSPGWSLDAFVAGGDIDYIGPGTVGSSSSTFMRAYNDSNISTTPVFFVVGNHEADNIYDVPVLEDKYSSYPAWNLKAGPSSCPGTTYSFDKGDLHVSVINVYCDTGGDKITAGDVPNLIFDWLKEDLRSSDKKYKVVIGHEPAYPNGRHEGDSLDAHPENRDRFWNLLVTEKVFAYLAGHVHISRMADFEGVFEMNTGTSGSSRNSGIGSNPYTTLNYIHAGDSGVSLKQVQETRNEVGWAPPRWPAATSITKTQDDISKEVLVNTFERAGKVSKYWVDYDSSVESNPDWSSNNGGKWWESSFDPSSAGWSSGETGAGYDLYNASKWGWLNTNVNADPNSSGTSHVNSILQRIPFSVYNKDKFSNLKLGLDYSGGITAWINGIKVYESPNAPAFNSDDYSANFDKSASGPHTSWGKELLSPSFQDIDLSEYKDLLNNGDDNLLVISSWSQNTFSLISGVKLTLQPNSGPYKYWISYNDAADFSNILYASTGHVSNGGGDEDVGDMVSHYNGSETGVQFAYSSGSPGEKAGAEDNGGAGRTVPVYPSALTDAFNEFGTKINLGAVTYSRSGISSVVTFDHLSSEKKYELTVLGMRGRYLDKWCRYTLSDATSFSNVSSTGTEISTYTEPNDSTTYNCGDNYQNGYVAKWTDIIPGSSTLKMTFRGVAHGSYAAGESYISTFKLAETRPGNPTITSASDSHLVLSDETAIIPSPSITIQDDPSTSTIKAAKDIRIKIPDVLSMKWDSSITSLTIEGAAASKVSSSVSYEQSGRVLVIPVESDFSSGDLITVSGLNFTGLGAVSSSNNLELILDGSDGYPLSYDTKSISIGKPSITSAESKVFAIGGVSKPASVITISEDSISPTIKESKDIRIRIPDSLNLVWDTSHSVVEITGNASEKLASTTATFEDANKTVVLDVGEDFLPGDVVSIGNLYLTGASAPGATDSFLLEVDNEGNVTNSDSKPMTVAPMPIISIAENTPQPTVLPAGSENAVLGVISIVSSANGTGVNSITLKENGTINASTDLSDTELWLSSDASWDSSDTQIDESKAFAGLDGRVVFTGPFTIDTTTKYLIVRTTLKTSAKVGRRINFKFEEAQVDLDCGTANFPLDLTNSTKIDPIPVTWLTDSDWSTGTSDETIFIHDNKVGVGYWDDFNTSLENNKWSDNTLKWTKEGVATGSVDVSDSSGGAGTGYLHVVSPNKLSDPVPSDLDTTHGVFNLPPGKTLNPRYTLWYNGVIIMENSDAATSFSKGRFASYMYQDATHFFSLIGTTHWGAYRITRASGNYASTYFTGSATTPVGVVSPVAIPGSPINAKITVGGTTASSHVHAVYATSGTPTSATIAHTDTTNLAGARTFAFSASYHLNQNPYQNVADSIWLRGGFSGGNYTTGWKDTGETIADWRLLSLSASLTGDQSISMVVRSSEDGTTVSNQTDPITVTDGSHDYDLSSLGSGRYLSMEFTLNTGSTNDTPTINSASWSKIVDEPVAVPGAPINLQITKDSNNINLAWSRNLDAEDVFCLERQVDTGDGFDFWEELMTVEGTATSFSDEGVIQDNQRYKYRIRSANGVGFSDYTESAIISAPPAAPSNLNIRDVKIYSIDWIWSDNSLFEEGFRLRLLTGGNDTFDIPSNSTNYEITNLTQNTAYSVGLKSFEASETSSETSSETFYTLVPVSSNFQATNTIGGVALSVDAIPNETLGQSGYYFENLTKETNSGWITEATWQDTDLEDNTAYDYQVKQRNYDGLEGGRICFTGGDCTSRPIVNLTQTTRAPLPQNFAALAGLSIISLSVDSFNNDDVSQSGYYFLNETNSTNSDWTTEPTWAENSLEPNTAYSYKVKQRNSAGVETEVVSLNKATLAPLPQNITSSIGSTSIRMDVDSFPNDSLGQSGYYFENKTTNNNSGWIGNNTWEEFGLTCATNYSYEVKYRNQEGIETEVATAEEATSACTNDNINDNTNNNNVNDNSGNNNVNDNSGNNNINNNTDNSNLNDNTNNNNINDNTDNSNLNDNTNNNNNINDNINDNSGNSNVNVNENDNVNDNTGLVSLGDMDTKNLSSKERATMVGNKIIFRSNLGYPPAIKGKIQIVRDGRTIRKTRVNNFHKWRISVRERYINAPHNYQFFYFDSEDNLIEESRAYSLLLDKKRPIIKNPKSFVRKKPGESVVVEASDNGKVVAYSFTLRGKNYGKQGNNYFILPQTLPRGVSRMTIFVFDEVKNSAKKSIKILNR